MLCKSHLYFYAIVRTVVSDMGSVSTLLHNESLHISMGSASLLYRSRSLWGSLQYTADAVAIYSRICTAVLTFSYLSHSIDFTFVDYFFNTDYFFTIILVCFGRHKLLCYMMIFQTDFVLI